MISNVVARRYAKALIATIEKERDYDIYQRELSRFYNYLVNNQGVGSFLNDPSVTLILKRKTLSEILKNLNIPPMLGRFFNLILEKDRLRYLEAILRYFEEIANQRLNRMKVMVRGAYQLESEQIEKLKSRLHHLTGREIILDMRIDPEIIGGLMIQIGSTIYNGSVKGQLERLKAELTRG